MRSLAVVVAVAFLSQPAGPVFSIHKYQMKVGEESPGAMTLSYLGSAVKLQWTIERAADGTPARFSMSGDTSTQSHVDYQVSVDGRTITVRDGQKTTTQPKPDGFVINAGYAPMVLQQDALKHWQTHGKPAEIAGAPIGPVAIEPRGRDTFTLNGKPVALDRYTFSGFSWGRLVAWADRDSLIASIGEDAEFDRFEAVAAGYEPLLSEFVRKSAETMIAAMKPATTNAAGTAAPTIAITGGTLWDGTGSPPLADAVVVIRDGRIVAAGNRGSVTVPSGARMLNAAGGTILPGLWEMHAHYAAAELGPAYLAAGVTTVRDAGNDFDFVVPIRDAIEAARLVGPRMLLAGYVDGVGPAGLGSIRASTPDEGRAVVRRYQAARFQQIKIYGNAQLSPDTVRAITDEAHKLGMTVTGHVPRGMNALQAIDAGYDQINHIGFVTAILRPRPQPGTPPAPLDLSSEQARAGIARLVEKKIVIDPSFARAEYNSHDIARPFEEYEPGAAYAPRPLREIFNHTGVPTANAERAAQGRQTSGAVLLALQRAGVPIVAGIDLVVPGYSLTRELEWYVKSGLTPAEALATATINSARAMKRDKDLGTIEPGKLADVIIVQGDPLKTIGDLRNVKTVITNGRVHDPAALWKSVGWRTR